MTFQAVALFASAACPGAAGAVSLTFLWCSGRSGFRGSGMLMVGLVGFCFRDFSKCRLLVLSDPVLT